MRHKLLTNLNVSLRVCRVTDGQVGACMGKEKNRKLESRIPGVIYQRALFIFLRISLGLSDKKPECRRLPFIAIVARHEKSCRPIDHDYFIIVRFVNWVMNNENYATLICISSSGANKVNDCCDLRGVAQPCESRIKSFKYLKFFPLVNVARTCCWPSDRHSRQKLLIIFNNLASNSDDD